MCVILFDVKLTLEKNWCSQKLLGEVHFSERKFEEMH